MAEFTDELSIAVEAARAGGAEIHRALRRSGGQIEIRNKGAVDLVTEVDLASEESVLSVLARRSPGTPVLTEEGGGDWSLYQDWVVDINTPAGNAFHNTAPYYYDGAVYVSDWRDTPGGHIYKIDAATGTWSDMGGQLPGRANGIFRVGDEMVQVDSGFQRNDVEGGFRPRFQCGPGFSPE